MEAAQNLSHIPDHGLISCRMAVVFCTSAVKESPLGLSITKKKNSYSRMIHGVCLLKNHILYFQDGNLMAESFDPKTGALGREAEVLQ